MPIPLLDLSAFRHRSRPKPAFVRGPDERPLRVLIDRRFLDPAGLDTAQLFEFVHHPLVDMIAWEGDDIANREPPRGITVAEINESADRVLLNVVDSTGAFQAMIWPYRQWRVFADRLAAERKGSPDKTWSEVLLARAAVAWFADLVVTESKLLLKSTNPEIRQANPMRPADALAIIGLFLRQRDSGVYKLEDRATFQMSQEGLYQVAARALLPEGWRVHSAAVDNSTSTGDKTLPQLTETVHRRVERALYARDLVMGQLQKPRPRVTPVDFLYHLDALLVQLVGAADALARIADAAAGLNTDVRQVGWGNTNWTTALIGAEPAFRPALAVTPAAGTVLELLAVLRNNIHGDILRPTVFQNSGVSRFKIVVPVADRQRVQTLLQHLGGTQSWGAHVPRLPDEATIDTGVFVEKLVSASLDAINDLMRCTPVERLPGYNPTTTATPDATDEMHGTAMVARLRLLFGFA